jgi:hypothetical protein
MNETGITHIINVTSDIENTHKNLQYYRVPILDSEEVNISEYFQETYNYIGDNKFFYQPK